MATEHPESEYPEAQDAPDAPADPNPLLGDSGAVPLLPPGEDAVLPGQLETAPDGSIRPVTPSGAHPPDLSDFSVAADGPGNEFAPPAPGLMDDAAAPADAPNAPAPAEGGLPAWATEADPPAASIGGGDNDERAAWPTVEPDAATTPSAAPPPAIPEQPVQPPAQPGDDVPESQSTIVRPPEEATSGADMYDVPLGTLVYRSGLLSADQIESALAESERIGKRLGEVLIDSKMIDERDLGRLLAGQKGLPFLDLGQMTVEPDAPELLPAASARIYCALPIAIEKGTPVVAVSDPTNGLVVEGVRRAMGGELSFAVATRSDLQRAIAASYGEEGASAADAAPSEPVSPVAPPAAASTPPQTAAPLEIDVTPQAPPAAASTDPSPTSSEEPMTSSQPDLSAGGPLASGEPLSTPSTPPEAAPTPILQADPAHESQQGTKTVRVMIRLTDGDQIDAGGYSTNEQAIERARALIGSIESQSGGEWPFLSGRFLRPETIVSIDLIEERPRF